MKKPKNPHKNEYTLLQDLMETYRYPDGTLNRIAVFISALALVLLITVGHFIISGIRSIKDMDTVSASELSADEMEQYITNCYMDAIAGYAQGDINQALAKKKILKFLADYIQSSNGFTLKQNESLKEIIKDYLNNTTIYSDIDKNANDIKALSALIENKYQENIKNLNTLKDYLQTQLDNNNTLDEETRKNLKETIDALRTYVDDNDAISVKTLEHYINNINSAIRDDMTNADNTLKDDMSNADDAIKKDLADSIFNLDTSLRNDMTEANTNLQNNINNVENNLTTEDENLKKMIDQINNRISDNDVYFEFGYDPNTGSYGYYVGDQFKPW